MAMSLSKTKQVNMLNGPILKNIVAFTMPLIFSNILQLLFNAADLIIVGQHSQGELYIGAVGATTTLTHLIVNLFIGFSSGAGVVTAQALGSRDEEAIHKTVHTSILFSLISGILLTVVGITISTKMLELMGTPKDIIGLSSTYLRIYMGGAVFILLYNFGAAILRASGDTTGPLMYLTVAGALNVVLNLLFVKLLDMNVDGVAYATVISQAVSAILVVVRLMCRTDACKLYLGKLRFWKKPLLKIITIGLPAGIQSSVFSASNVIIQSSLNSFGSVVVSANSAVLSIEGFLGAVTSAFSHTALNFTGQNMGAENYARIKKVVRVCYISVLVAGGVIGNLAVIFGRQLLQIYLPNSSEAIDYGMIRVFCMWIPYFMCGIMDVSTGALRGMGYSTQPMIITILGACVFRVAWIYTVFQKWRTLESIYISYPISWVLVFVVEVIVFAVTIKKLQRKKSEENREKTEK